MSLKKWVKLLTKQIIPFGKYYQVDVDEVQAPSGQIVEYSVVRLQPYALIIPISPDGSINMVEQHRYCVNEFSIEFPMGNTDGQDPLIAAKRELEEEAGLTSDNWEQIGIIHEGIGYSENIGYIFIARNVKKKKRPKKDPLDKNLFAIRKYKLSQIKEKITKGKIKESATISSFAIALLQNKLT